MKTIARMSLLVLMFCMIINVSAQDFYADSYSSSKNKTSENPTKSVNKEEVKSKEYIWKFDSSVPTTFNNNTLQKAEEHEFGSKVACLKVLMEESFVTQEEMVPGDPMKRTIIKKPNIYNTARKIEKHLKKEVKNGDISLEKATSEFIHVLEVSMAIVNEAETESFEKYLDTKKKNIEDQINIFNQVQINSIY